jgi:hypothetical protein
MAMTGTAMASPRQKNIQRTAEARANQQPAEPITISMSEVGNGSLSSGNRPANVPGLWREGRASTVETCIVTSVISASTTGRGTELGAPPVNET